MSKDLFQVMSDLNKLAAGTIRSNKLLVVQRCWYENDKNEFDRKNWLDEKVKELAKKQEGSFYVAYIPHPDEWYDHDSKQSVVLSPMT